MAWVWDDRGLDAGCGIREEELKGHFFQDIGGLREEGKSQACKCCDVIITDHLYSFKRADEYPFAAGAKTVVWIER